MAQRAAAGHRTLIVFVKYPAAGKVKTRLVPALGNEDAAAVYRALVDSVLRETTPRAGEYERLVFYDPPEATEAMRRWLPSGGLRRQSTGDLGARMADAFARAFARGARRVAIVGSDVPSLSHAEVTEAFDALEAADLVLGPALDGGYYLVALRQPVPFLFEGVRWSSRSVMEDTLARAASGRLSVRRLESRRDLDTLDDLREEWERIGPLLARDPGLRARVEQALAAPPPA